ncbi:MAG: J domain-containing protein [Deltaproteobacteria bacterium]|nr:J domain-containing protein [Deltaproteobacteria bacterium]
MSVATVYVSMTDAGHVAAWRDTPPTVDPFRISDHVFEVGQEKAYSIMRAALQALCDGRPLSIGELPKKWANADKRARLGGRKPWKGAPPPDRKPYMGEVYRGHRLRDAVLELLTAEEILRVRELEIASNQRIAAALAEAQARGVVPFDADALRQIAGIEAAIDHVFGVAFARKHPPIDWEERMRLLRGDAPIVGASPFVVLGLEPTKDLAAIRTAWKRRALETHPDRGGSADDFRRAKAAYDACVAAAHARA